MADIRITNVPAVTTITASNDLYIKTGSNFRRVPVSKLLELIENELDFTPEPDFNTKVLVMHKVNDVYNVYDEKSDFKAGDYASFARFAEAINVAHLDGYNVACQIDGEYLNAVPFLADFYDAMLKFGGWELSDDGLQPVVYTLTANGFEREVLDMGSSEGGGGGGTAEVTAAAVAAAIGEMNTSQKNSSRQNLGAEAAGAAAAVQTNLNAVLALVPSNASANNQLATKGDLPTLTNRNSSTDTVEVKKDPTTQKLYVPTYPSGGAIAPADIVNATGQMTSEQKSDTRQNIGAEQSGAAAAVQTNLDAVTEKIPSGASYSNKLATQADLPVFSNRNSSTDTVEVKKDPTTKKLYVPTYPSGGGGSTPETVNLTMTVGQSSTELSVALGYSALSAKIAAGARLVSSLTLGYESISLEWHVIGANSTQESISLYAVLEDSNGQNLLVAYLLENQTNIMSGTVESQPIGNAKNPTVVTKSGASPSAFSLADNTIYECGELTALTISSATATGTSVITFTSGATATTASFPANVLFSDDQPDVTNGAFVPSANYSYEINIRNRRALVSRWAVSV